MLERTPYLAVAASTAHILGQGIRNKTESALHAQVGHCLRSRWQAVDPGGEPVVCVLGDRSPFVGYVFVKVATATPD